MKSNMKENIKESAINLFYKKGYYATGVSDIARLTGIQKSSIYYHYANKEDILVDIYNSTMEKLFASFKEALQGVTGAEARIRAAIHCHIMFHIRLQKETIIADSELRGLTTRNYQTIIQLRDDYEVMFQAIVQEGIDLKLFQVADVKVITYAIIAMCTSVCAWFKPSGRLSSEEIAAIYANFILNALKA